MKAVALAAVVASLAFAGCTQNADQEGEVEVTATEWGFSFSRSTFEAGETVTFVFKNEGGVAHNFGGDWGRTDTIQSGETTRLTVTFDEAGDYVYWCSVSGHRDAGMEGMLRVA